MVEIIIAVVALAIGGGIGYAIFRYVLKGQYQEAVSYTHLTLPTT